MINAGAITTHSLVGSGAGSAVSDIAAYVIELELPGDGATCTL